jgi:hypothetical protein
MAISSPMNSDLSTITHPLTSLSLGLTMLPMEEILSDLIVTATTPSLVPHLLEGGLHSHIPTDSHVVGGATLTSFLAVAFLLALFAKSVTLWDTSLLIVPTTTTSPSPETLLSHHKANLSAPAHGPDLNWYPESDATHHVTFDMKNLNFKSEEFHGPDQVRIGNGKGLSIHHIGHTRLFSPTLHFDFLNVLHVPQISKNLLSVHKFTYDTNTFFEFHPNYFLLNDRRSKKLLLHDPNSHGLY